MRYRIFRYTIWYQSQNGSFIMLPRTNLQGWKNEQANTLQKVLAEFQQNMCDVLQQSLEDALHMVLQLNQQPNFVSTWWSYFQQGSSDAKKDLYKELYGQRIFDIYANEDLIIENVDPICDVFDGEDLSYYVYCEEYSKTIDFIFGDKAFETCKKSTTSLNIMCSNVLTKALRGECPLARTWRFDEYIFIPIYFQRNKIRGWIFS